MNRTITGLLAVALMATAAGAAAQEYATVREINMQAQEMGDVWRATYSTPWGQTSIDAPILIPDVDALPVLTLEMDQPLSEQEVVGILAQYPRKYEDQLAFEGVVIGSEAATLDLGLEIDGRLGWDAAQSVGVTYGALREGGLGEAEPVTYHFGWTIDEQTAALSGSALTVGDVMALWRAEIERFYPGRGHDIALRRVEAHGSALASTAVPETDEPHVHYRMEAEQLLGGVPIMGKITEGFETLVPKERGYAYELEQAREPYEVTPRSVNTRLSANCANATDRDFSLFFFKQTGVRLADVPLAPLSKVIAGLADEIRAGRLWKVYALRLGYLLYRDVEVQEIVAVPRWVAEAVYVQNAKEETYDTFQRVDAWRTTRYDPQRDGYTRRIPIDAQTGEPILFAMEECDFEAVFGAPEMVTWEEAKQQEEGQP